MSRLNTITCAIWAEFIRNPRLYALLAGQPILLGSIIWLATVVAAPRWSNAALQLDTLRWLIILLAMTHAIVAIAMAAVRVKGTGPGGFSLDVGGDDEPTETHIEGDVTLTEKG